MTAAPTSDRFRRFVLAAIGGVGASAVMTQLALMRELLAAFSGNELVFGICLGTWLLLTGVGAWLGRWVGRRPNGVGTDPAAETIPGDATPSSRASARGVAAPAGFFIGGLILIAIIPLFQVVAVRVLRDLVFVRGATVGVTGTVLGSLALLLPFCLVSGALFSLACGLRARTGATGEIGRVYLADTAGAVAGGALFTFALVPWFDHIALLCFPAFWNLLLAGVLAGCLRAWFLLQTATVVTAGLALHVALVDADLITTVLQYRGEQVVYRANSPYGRLVVGRSEGLFTFHENGVPVAATENILQTEETVHYAMCQRPGTRRVLLIGGGVAGTARELLRYDGVSEVRYVEIDPAIIAAGRKLLAENLDDPRIHIAATDGRRLVRQARGQFDAVIVDLPDPSTSQLNRFHTAEFFREVRRALAPGGVLAFGLAHYENYVSPELARLLASAHHTLSDSFAHVRMIPGGRVFFLASDEPLSLDIATRLEEREIHPRFVNRNYLDAMLAPDRLADLERAVGRPAAANTDFNPVLYYLHLRHWLSQVTAGDGRRLGGIAGAALALGFAVYLVRLGAVPRLIFAAGFAASGLEVVLLLACQVLYGSLYRQVGLVVTVFMAGLAAGAWWAQRRLRRWNALTSTRSSVLGSSRSIVLLSLVIAALAAALPWLLRVPAALGAATDSDVMGQGFLLLLTLALALPVGAQFPLAGAASPGDSATVAARLLAADLAGAALGALLVSTFLIPLLGVTTVCLATAGLNAAAAVLAWSVVTRP